jgi:serine/threonine protein kinase
LCIVFRFFALSFLSSYEMLVGTPPFYGDSNFTVFEKIINTVPAYPPDLDPHARDLIEKLLVAEPTRRLGGIAGVEEVQAHPFFYGIDWAKLCVERSHDDLIQLTLFLDADTRGRFPRLCPCIPPSPHHHRCFETFEAASVAAQERFD